MAKLTLEDREVTYDDSPETKQKVFDRLLEFYRDHDFTGEVLVQSDSPWEHGVPMLAELADEVFRFEVHYEGD